MNVIRRTLDIDAGTDARLREMADERGQDVAAVLAEAVALLDSVVDISGPDIGEDRRRQDFATALLKARSIVAREVAFGNKEAAEEDDKLAERFLLRLGQETALDRLRELTCG